MSAGYVKLHRSFRHSELFRDPLTCQFFVYCITSASYKERKVLVNKQVVSLKPGQFIFGRKKAADELGTTERKVRTLLKLFEKIDFLTIQATNRFSIISIVNWSVYQNGEEESDQPAVTPTTSKRPADDHIQEGKEGKEGKEGNSIPPEITRFVEIFQGYIAEQHGKKAPRITASKTRSDTETVEKLIRLDGFSFDDVKDVLRWALRDPFWQDQILSLSALRKKKDGLTKFQKVAAAYDRDSKAATAKKKKRSTPEEDAAMIARVQEKMKKGKSDAGISKYVTSHD